MFSGLLGSTCHPLLNVEVGRVSVFDWDFFEVADDHSLNRVFHNGEVFLVVCKKIPDVLVIDFEEGEEHLVFTVLTSFHFSKESAEGQIH